MATFDIIILIIFFGFVGAGYFFGLIHTIGAILGVVVGVVAAGNLAPQVAPFLQFFLLREQVARVLAFIIIFIVVSRLIGYIIHAMDKGFKLARFIPFATTANRLAGALFGFIEAALVLGVILLVMKYAGLSPEVNTAIENSSFAGILVTIAGILSPLLPESWRTAAVEALPTL